LVPGVEARADRLGVMPRMFMAIRQEDRHPIVEIMRETPEIPDGRQPIDLPDGTRADEGLSGGPVRLADLLKRFPVALLSRD